MLDKSFFSRETNIKANVVCDSINEQGIRLTTFEIEYPRIVMSEFNTHRSVSKNSSSSRAIPVSKMLEHTKNINLKPVYFGSKKSGMQAGDELVGEDLEYAHAVWDSALASAIGQAELLDDCGVAKEVTNRLVEPFQLVKVVCTATDWENFFNLRLHPDSDPNICMLAYKVYQAMQESKPVELKSGEWHLPFVDKLLDENLNLVSYGVSHEDDTYGTMHKPVTLEQAIKLSAASCASVSYRTEGMTLEKADKIFDMLIKAEVIHASPFEHLATPISKEIEIENSDYLTVGFINKVGDSNTWQQGITHMNKQGQLCSGNLRGFVQYRHLLPNNTNWKFDFEERMKLFN